MPPMIKIFKSELTALSVCIPVIIVLILLEALIDKDFICPCDAKLNANVTNFIFAGPFVLAFFSMCIILLWINYKVKDTFYVFQLIKMLLLCLIPPFVWIILVLLDGEYVACGDTDWNGLYVTDDQLHFRWCKPTDSFLGRNDTELQALTTSFIFKSQMHGFVMLLSLSIFLILLHVCCCCSDDKTETQSKKQNEKEEFTGTFVCHRSEPTTVPTK